jgi:hypothetical protein
MHEDDWLQPRRIGALDLLRLMSADVRDSGCARHA